MAIGTIGFNAASAAYRQTSSMQTEMPVLPGAASGGTDFSALIHEAISSVSGSLQKSEMVSAQALTGKASVVDLVTAMGNAEMTLSAVTAVRDRVISAYQDILKMPI